MAATEPEIEQVYRARYVGFRNALVPVAGGFEAARDAVQEGFALALRRRRSFRGEGSLEAWIWTIAYREALRARRAGDVVLEEAVDGAVDLGIRGDDELAAAVQALSPRRKLVVFLRHYAGFSYAEIAGLCAISEGTVAATLAQAHAELASALDREGAVA